jgi:C-terminal processing protease CtpA/Prc
MCKKRCTPEDISEKRVAQVTVVEVACGSPADVAGVKVGDSIKQINEVHVFGATFESYQAARGGESAVSVKPVRVSIERGEKYRPERLVVTMVPAVLTRPIDWTCGK